MESYTPRITRRVASGTHSPGKQAKLPNTIFKNNHLKTLEIILRVYWNKKILLKKICRKTWYWDSLWHLSYNPFTILPWFRLIESPLQVSAAKKAELPVSFQSRLTICHPLQLQIKKNKFLVSVAKKSRGSLPPPSLHFKTQKLYHSAGG